jgi:O-antigen/teichoic acid export membrane protein
MVFLLFASLAVARLLGPGEYGLYSLALALPLLLQMLVGFGVRTAVNRYSAYNISKGDTLAAQRMTKNAILFLILTALALTALSVTLSSVISLTLLNRPQLTLYVEAASTLIFGQALYNFLTPAFVGWSAPLQDAFWTTVQAILKFAISVVLILLGFGIFGALYGYVFSCLLSGIFGIIALYLIKLRGNSANKETGWSFARFSEDVKEMIKFGFPVYIGNIILVFSQQPVITIILSYIATNTIIGYYSAASNITQTLSVISAALTPAFFTAFASLNGMNSDTGLAFRYAVKYVSYFMMPLIIFLLAAADLLIDILYGKAYLQSSYFLELLTIAYLPYAFGYSVLIPYFSGTGNTKMIMFMNIVEALGTLAPALILVLLLKLGISGLLLAIIISNVGPTAFGLYSAQKYLRVKVDYSSLARTFFVSILCYLLIYALSLFQLSGISYLFSFPIELVVYFVSYITLMPLAGAVQMDDIVRLKMSTRGIRVLDRFLDIILGYESFLVKWIEKA